MKIERAKKRLATSLERINSAALEAALRRAAEGPFDYTISPTFTFVNGTVADANQMNTDLGTLFSWANGGVDHANVNPAVGFFASDLKGTSTAANTFGGTAGYVFAASGASVTPLTVAGFAAQSSDIFDVLTLPSGGAKVFGIASTGNAFFGAAAFANANGTNGILTIARGDAAATTSGGLVFGNGTSAQTAAIGSGTGFGGANNIGFFPAFNSNASLQVTLAGAYSTFQSPPSVAAGAAVGDFIAQRSASTGAIFLGGATLSASFSQLTGGPVVMSWSGSPSFKEFDINGQLACATSGSATLSYVPPVYTPAGAATGGSLHMVFGTGVGTGGAQSVPLAGAATFTNAASYVVMVSGNVSVATVTPTAGNAFSVTAVNGAPFAWMAIGT